MKSKVIIIGTGAAGLMAAKTLKEKQIDFVILEATDHVGGRAQTLKGNPHIEFGPEFLHGKTPLTDELLEEYNLPYYDMHFDYHLFYQGKLSRMPDFWDRMGSILGNISLKGKDLPFNEYLEKYDHHSKMDREITKLFVEGFDAADLNLVSTKALREMKDQVMDPDMRRMRRPLRGYGELMDKMGEDLFVDIYFQHVVNEIEWKKDHVIVRGKDFEFKGEKVIDTVSVAVLKKQNILPMPSALTKWLDQVEMGQVVKMVIELDFEFFHLFENHVFPFVSAPELHFSAWWTTTPIHTSTVTAWAGGERARVLLGMGQEEREKVLLSELAQISSVSVKKLGDWVKKIHFHNWAQDPAVQGAYSYPKVMKGKKASLQTDFDHTLYLAGEAYHEEMSGTIEGALVSGREAALKITGWSPLKAIENTSK